MRSVLGYLYPPRVASMHPGVESSVPRLMLPRPGWHRLLGTAMVGEQGRARVAAISLQVLIG